MYFAGFKHEEKTIVSKYHVLLCLTYRISADNQYDTMKYILVTGGVISGIGKGIIASSVGTILKSCGLHVTAIKIDPYINIDAGTFSPYEHGKCRMRWDVCTAYWGDRACSLLTS